MEPRLALVFDVGTTSVKAGLVELPRLRLLAAASAPSEIVVPRPGWAEQDPDRLWSTIVGLARRLVEEAPRRRIDAVVFTAYMASVVPVGGDGRPLRNIILWLDTRAAGLPEELWRGPIRVSGYNPWRLLEFLWITGGAPSSTGKDVLSKLVWLSREEPDIYKSARWFLGAVGYLVYRATGVPVYPADDAHLTWLADTRGGRVEWHQGLLRRYGVRAEALPPIRYSVEPAGRLSSDAAAEMGVEGEPVVLTGMGDVASAALGSGYVEPGRVHVYLGTSGWSAAHSERRRLDVLHYIGSLASAVPGRYLVISEQETAGAALEWAARVLGYTGVEEALADAQEARGGSTLFAPWLFGERSPIDDPRVAGVWVGFNLATGRGDLALSVVEGIVYNTVWGLEYLERLVGRADRIRLVGGLARSGLVAQVLADTTGRIVEVPRAPEHAGLMGAAIVAAVGLGLTGFDEAAARIPIAAAYKPGPDAPRRRRLYRIYRGLYGTLRGVLHALAPEGSSPGLA